MAEKKIIDAMFDDAPVDVTTEVNFIWSIANKLRGPYQSDKYKDVIIPMVIIRRFRDLYTFSKRFAQPPDIKKIFLLKIAQQKPCGFFLRITLSAYHMV